MKQIKRKVRGTTNETKEKFKEKTSPDIIDAKWTRNCPKCFEIIFYKRKHAMSAAIKTNTICKLCYFNRLDGFTKQSEWSRICSCGKITTYATTQGFYRARQNRSVCRSCTQAKNIQSEETKLKRRLRKCMMYGGISYNPSGCVIFDEINEELGWFGQHALNGGEIQITGYFVDYYEASLNIVIEYDEAHHEINYHRKKDAIRQGRIVAEKNCQFYRIKQGQDWREVLLSHGVPMSDNKQPPVKIEKITNGSNQPITNRPDKANGSIERSGSKKK